MHVHHLVGGVGRSDEPCNLLLLDADCHGKTHDDPNGQRLTQGMLLTVKCLEDQDEFDLGRLTALKGQPLELEDLPEWLWVLRKRRRMKTCADDVRAAWPLFQAARSGATPTSALSFRLVKIDFQRALELNRLWHSRLPRMGVGAVKTMPFLCFAAEFDGIYYAVAIWSNPVARNLPQQTWLELRRFAIASDAPPNTASRLLGIMARLVRRERADVERLISYQDLESHAGTIYKAAGWTPTTVNADGNWTRAKRQRPKSQSEAAKQRWEKVLNAS